jgi:hypothetical protein
LPIFISASNSSKRPGGKSLRQTRYSFVLQSCEWPLCR